MCYQSAYPNQRLQSSTQGRRPTSRYPKPKVSQKDQAEFQRRYDDCRKKEKERKTFAPVVVKDKKQKKSQRKCDAPAKKGKTNGKKTIPDVMTTKPCQRGKDCYGPEDIDRTRYDPQKHSSFIDFLVEKTAKAHQVTNAAAKDIFGSNDVTPNDVICYMRKQGKENLMYHLTINAFASDKAASKAGIEKTGQ